MKLTPRRLFVGGLALGAAVAGLKRCSRRNESSRADEFITERHATAFLVRRRIEPERVEVVREYVLEGITDSDSAPLLALEGSTTASLFLDRGAATPELVWYVEVPRFATADWDDPEATVAAAFPIEHEALGAAADTAERELLVHAVNPTRPQTVVSGEAESSPVAGVDDERAVDVELVRVQLEPGVPERLADWFAALSRRFAAGDLDLGPVQEWSAEMIDVESMFTESIFLERGVEGYALAWYMEADEMRRVYDAYYDARNPVARLSEFVLDRILVDSNSILDYPLDTDAEVLAHAVTPDRPRRVADLSNSHE